MWIICNLNKPYDLSHFQRAAKRLNVDLQIIDPQQMQIISDEHINLFYQGRPIAAPDYLLNWNGCMNGMLEQQIEASLNQAGTVICNSLSEINHWQDKFRWQVETSLKTVKSLKLHSSNLLASLDLIERNFKYPLIVKSDTGSLGLGVYQASDTNNLKQIFELISLLDTNFKIHIEEFIDYDHDLRMYVIGNDYYLMERVATDDFRANVAREALCKAYPKTELTEQIFNQVRTEYNAVTFGVDILLTDTDYYLCEINSAPGFTGIEQVNDIDIAEEIIKATMGFKK
ncbi:hypothetical protein RZE82_05925 [Mollicutes bacterium LVI A0039]|nr:hypothetical protein RZE82_05925 [Mollicutes bacterium LVI A0039]